MERQLVTVQKIHSIQPIEGRDRVLRAKILGWDVIVGKDVYYEGELVCFAEIDSLFPKTETWADLERFKYRIKTFKVNTSDGPIYGQGYCFPISVLDGIVDKYPSLWFEGDNVTDILGVTKYEVPEKFVTGDSAGDFPSDLISKTDEMRVQSVMDVLDELRGHPYVIRQKADGSSGTFLVHPRLEKFTVSTRNLMKKSPEESGKNDLFWRVARKNKLEEILSVYSEYALQGEVVGEGIQKNLMGFKGNDLLLFNIVYLPERRRLYHEEFEDMMTKFREINPELKACKVVEIGDNFQHTLESLIELSNHQYDSGKPAEGIVIRSLRPMKSRVLGGDMSFKTISPEYLCSGGN